MFPNEDGKLGFWYKNLFKYKVNLFYGILDLYFIYENVHLFKG